MENAKYVQRSAKSLDFAAQNRMPRTIEIVVSLTNNLEHPFEPMRERVELNTSKIAHALETLEQFYLDAEEDLVCASREDFYLDAEETFVRVNSICVASAGFLGAKDPDQLMYNMVPIRVDEAELKEITDWEIDELGFTDVGLRVLPEMSKEVWVEEWLERGAPGLSGHYEIRRTKRKASEFEENS
ncbi:hypothetical protein BDV95DRAFT_142244 [Massariosphaeria phaeospora]|uniref:Uncharacterized protein n=1 Tax=Massariosphaeria phaeospora TaxID=100035 RepID=A0A7C8IE10_9PLEO|nr:hypothetical protein BDV95DRAFT_142244 [Massariosphaeria phaeospora]